MSPAEEVGKPHVQSVGSFASDSVQSQTSTTGQEMELVPGRKLPLNLSSKASSSVSVTTGTEPTRFEPIGTDNSD